MKISRHGFTLIEMLAVIAMIGILASLAIPSYMDRIVRQQIEAALPLADIAKKPRKRPKIFRCYFVAR